MSLKDIFELDNSFDIEFIDFSQPFVINIYFKFIENDISKIVKEYKCIDYCDGELTYTGLNKNGDKIYAIWDCDENCLHRRYFHFLNLSSEFFENKLCLYDSINNDTIIECHHNTGYNKSIIIPVEKADVEWYKSFFQIKYKNVWNY